jgi:hypothetical protein
VVYEGLNGWLEEIIIVGNGIFFKINVWGVED